MAQRGRRAIPAEGRADTLLHTAPPLVEKADVVAGEVVTMLGGTQVPLERPTRIGPNALSSAETHPHGELGLGVAHPRGPHLEPKAGLLILAKSLAIPIGVTQGVNRLWRSPLC